MKARCLAPVIIVALFAACAGPSTNEEQRYIDPDLGVIRQYVVTGHMPSQVPLQPGGPIGLLLQGVGLMPKTQPLLIFRSRR